MAVNDVILKQNNIPANAPVQQSGAVAAAVPVNVTAQSSNDTLSTGNTQNTQAPAKRSVEQLYQAIQALCTSNGIDFNEVKKIGLLSTVSGKNEEYLLNAEDAEINKLVKLIEETIVAMKEDGIELTAENLEKQARGYRIVTENGWDSIASFRRRNNAANNLTATGKNNESVIQKLDRTTRVNGKKFSELTTPEERAQALKQYFKDFFEEKINEGKKPEDIINLQKTDFVKLLFNSSDEERAILKEAVPYLAGENRLDGLVALIDSFDTQEARTNCTNSMGYKYFDSMRVPDENFHTAASAENIRDMIAYATKHKDAEHITEYHNEAEKARAEFFTEENIAKLEAIKTKVENGEELTEEEKALLEDAKFHTANAAGEIVGVGNNVVISEDFRNEMLETLNADAYNNPNYREVLEQVNEYIKEHPECLNMSTEEFINKMNEITNGNFDKVINNSSEPLSAPAPKTEASTKPSNTPSTLTYGDIQNINANNAATIAQLYSNSTEETPVADVKTEKNASDNKANPVKRLIYCIKNLSDKTGNYAKELATLISRIPRALQTMCLQYTSGEAFNIILDNADNNAILATNGKGLSTYQSKLLAEKIEKIKEERKDDTIETLVG